MNNIKLKKFHVKTSAYGMTCYNFDNFSNILSHLLTHLCQTFGIAFCTIYSLYT